MKLQMTNHLPKQEYGITLVALIITIIILIILAAVSVNAVFNANFIGLATNGTINYAEAQSNEQKQMDDIADYMQNAIDKIDNNDFSGTGTQPQPTNEPPANLENIIGKYVDYVPVSKTYDESIIDTYSGSTQNNGFTTDTSLKWRIWNKDSTTLYLISDKQISTSGYSNNGSLYLNNFLGYNNGVTLLDDICNTCYSNNEYKDLKARNLKLEDVLSIKSENVVNTYEEQYLTKPYSYNYTSYIWLQHEQSDTDAINNRSIAYDLTKNTYQDNLNVQPNFTLWSSPMDKTDAYIYPQYKELLTDVASSRDYWLSSRYVLPSSHDACVYGLHRVTKYGILPDCSFVWRPDPQVTRYDKLGVRPLIEIPLSSCTLTETDDGYTISPK